MAQIRAATRDLSDPDTLRAHFGRNYFKFMWSDFPGRIFCRYEKVTLQSLADMKAVGISFLPEDDFEAHGAIPEGSLPFLQLAQARCGPTVAQGLADLCDSPHVRNDYLDAYLTWAQIFRGGVEPIEFDTGVSAKYQAASLAASLSGGTSESTSGGRTGNSHHRSNNTVRRTQSSQTDGSDGCCSIL
jgi:hypothetical protein